MKPAKELIKKVQVDATKMREHVHSRVRAAVWLSQIVSDTVDREIVECMWDNIVDLEYWCCDEASDETN